VRAYDEIVGIELKCDEHAFRFRPLRRRPRPPRAVATLQSRRTSPKASDWTRRCIINIFVAVLLALALQTCGSMPDYDFKQLSPYDFEHLSRDLLQAQEGLCVESFKTGRDNGIDFRFAGGSGKSIVQCKHYAMTGFVGLLRDLKKEIRNVEALSPDRYILITSVPLSPANKEKIRALFDKIIVTSDILGRDDLNNLLGLHPAIEKAHYKLWLTSRAVLDRVLHNAAATQSEFEVEKVYEQVRRYVSNAAYPRALDILNRIMSSLFRASPASGKRH
jgi:hypothetical protein